MSDQIRARLIHALLDSLPAPDPLPQGQGARGVTATLERAFTLAAGDGVLHTPIGRAAAEHFRTPGVLELLLTAAPSSGLAESALSRIACRSEEDAADAAELARLACETGYAHHDALFGAVAARLLGNGSVPAPLRRDLLTLMSRGARKRLVLARNVVDRMRGLGPHVEVAGLDEPSLVALVACVEISSVHRALPGGAAVQDAAARRVLSVSAAEPDKAVLALAARLLDAPDLSDSLRRRLQAWAATRTLPALGPVDTLEVWHWPLQAPDGTWPREAEVARLTTQADPTDLLLALDARHPGALLAADGMPSPLAARALARMETEQVIRLGPRYVQQRSSLPLLTAAELARRVAADPCLLDIVLGQRASSLTPAQLVPDAFVEQVPVGYLLRYRPAALAPVLHEMAERGALAASVSLLDGFVGSLPQLRELLPHIAPDAQDGPRPD